MKTDTKKFISKILIVALMVAFLQGIFLYSGLFSIKSLATGAVTTFDNCDSTSGWTAYGSTISLDTTDKKEGSASVKSVGIGSQFFIKSLGTPVNAGIYEQTGCLQFWLYVTDMSVFNGTGQIEITSSGTCDSSEYNWDFNKDVFPNLKNGWNLVSLHFWDASKIGTPNINSLNYFRLYTDVSSSTTLKIDKVVLFDAPDCIPGASSNCLETFDATANLISYTNTLSFDSNEKREGLRSMKSVGGSGTQIVFQEALSTAVNLGVNENDGTIGIWLNCSDVTKLTGGSLEITSSGISDQDEYSWDLMTLIKPYLGSNSWAYVSLDIGQATKIGNPNLGAINYIRLFADTTSSVTWRVDGMGVGRHMQFTQSLDNCGSTSGWGSTNTLSLDTSNFKTGAGALSQTGSNDVQYYKSFGTAVNTYTTEKRGYLCFWYYISDATKIDTSVGGQIEITSSGTSDSNEYSWNPASMPWYGNFGYLRTGWNFVVLKISQAQKIGSPNLSAINWFRIYCRVTAPITTKIDGIYFVEEGRKPSSPVRVPVRTPNPSVRAITLDSFDVPIAIYNVTDYGAAANDANDDTAAFQNALNDAATVGGGTVFAPAGQWVISTHLRIPPNVTLRGDWRNPDSGGLGIGTILKAYEGRDSGDTGYAFINMDSGAGLKNISIWYPDQNNISDIHTYPWTIRTTGRDGYFGTNLVNVTLINSYKGIKIDESGRYRVDGVYGTVLKEGMYINGVYEVGSIYNVKFSPTYWSNSGLGSPPSFGNIKIYTRANCTGITFARVDWIYAYNLYTYGMYEGIRFDKSPEGICNGQFYGITTEFGKTGVKIAYINSEGAPMLNFSMSNIGAEGGDGIALDCASTFVADSVIQFNTCTFTSPDNQPIVNNGTGMLSFVHCTFSNWSSSKYAVTANSGRLILEGNYFSVDKPDVYIGSSVVSAAILFNSFSGNTPNISNNSAGDIKIDTTTGSPSSVSQMPTAAPDVGTYKRPVNNNFYNVVSYGATQGGVTDCTTAFQNAINAANSAGGGTVYVPGGTWKISSTLTISSNVELRGCNEGYTRYQSPIKGTKLLAYYGKDNAGSTPFIVLGTNAGVRGLDIYYPEQEWPNVHVYPPTVKMNSTGGYLIDVQFPNSYTAVKVEAGGYYINNVLGLGLYRFIDIQNVTGTGYIRDCLATLGQWDNDDYNLPGDTWEQWGAITDTSTGYYINNASNINFFNNFGFELRYGVSVNGNSSNLQFYGQGNDISTYDVYLNGSGININFINATFSNSQEAGNIIMQTTPSFSGTVGFYNSGSAGSLDQNMVEIAGIGNVTIQQWNCYKGRMRFVGGTSGVEASSFTNSANQVILENTIVNGAVIACAGNRTSFGVTNNKGDPDVWMNIK